MPLIRGIQLIVTVDDGTGAFDCHAFDGLALPNPMLIQFHHVGTRMSQAIMNRLAAALLTELQVSSRATPVHPPCNGKSSACHALNEDDCHKLLVLVGDGVTPASASDLPHQWTSGRHFSVLPVLPETARTNATRILPSPLSAFNVSFWDRDVEEALSAVFQSAGVTAAQPRIFISYRQSDTAAAAIQLFDALSHDGFDTFLDHFRVPPGVDFQARLRQELGDKAMVLVLESANLASSPWVAFEIAEARACGLGLAALNFRGAPTVSGVDPSLRRWLHASDVAPDGSILPAALDPIRAFVRIEHDRAILRRRIMLEQSFEQAVVSAGGAAPVREANGSFRVNGAGKAYQAWLTARPPELPDYHRAHGATAAPAAGVIIGLSQLMEVSRQRQHEWLTGLCAMTLIDEGMMTKAARDMVGGLL